MKQYNLIYFYENNVILRFNKNIYYLSLNKLIINNGIILNKVKFLKEYNNFTKKNKLKKFINNRIIVLIQSNLSINDINKIYDVFEEIGIKIIKIIKDITLLNVSKKRAYLIGNIKLRVYLVNNYNKKEIINFSLEEISYNEISYILKNHVKENLFILSSNTYLIQKLLHNKTYYLINNYIKFIFDEVRL